MFRNGHSLRAASCVLVPRVTVFWGKAMAGLSLGGFGETATRFKARWHEFKTNQIVIHVSLVLTFLFLAIAAYLLGPDQFVFAGASLFVASAIVGYLIYDWFAEELRRKKVQLGDEDPRPGDAKNPDLRDEVLTICVGILLITPVLLQTLNDAYLHYDVSKDHFKVGSAVCTASDGSTFCKDNDRLWDLPSWFLFTLTAFAQVAPIPEEVGKFTTDWTGIKPSKATPPAAGLGLKLLFVGFLGTVVWGQYKNVARNIKDAISTLKVSHHFAAGLGPIALTALKKVIDNPGISDECKHNAILAIADIAQKYPLAKVAIQELVEEDLINMLAALPRRTASSVAPSVVYATALCQMDSERGILAVRDRVSNDGDFVRARLALLRVMSTSLSSERALTEFRQLERKLPQTGHLRNFSARFLAEATDGDGESDDGNNTPTPKRKAAASPPPVS
jgi:hypothetical protein